MHRKKHKEAEYFGGRIKGLVETAAALVLKDPAIQSDVRTGDYSSLHARLAATIEGYGKRDSCLNCKRSMRITVYEADLHDALLILAMARVVRENVAAGVPFTEANKVHLPTLSASHATIKRNTKCDYLGFVKQPDHWRGTGYWLLTSWAWKALRGDAVPAKVKYWEGHLIGRSEETTTLSQMYRKHRELVEAALAKKKAIKADHRARFDDYDPADWSDFDGNIQDEKPLFTPGDNAPEGGQAS